MRGRIAAPIAAPAAPSRAGQAATLGVLLSFVLAAGCGPARAERPAARALGLVALPSAPAADGAAVAPAAPTASAAPVAAIAPTASAAPAEGALTLERALGLAFERNPDLAAAAERIAEAEARLGEAGAAFLPQVTARLSYARTDNPLQAFGMIVAERRFSQALDVNNPGATENFRPEIAGGISVFRGFQDFERRRAAGLGVEAAALERGAIRNALADAVTAAYFGLLDAREQVDVARASVEAVSSELGQTRTRFDAGNALKSDVLSLEVRLAAARSGLVRVRNAVELARTALRTLMALPAEAPVEAAGVPAPVGGRIPATFGAALARSLAERPEIGAAAHLVEIRARELSAERGAYLPKVDAFAAYGQDARDLKLSRHQDSWTFGATLELDVFSGFSTTERVRAAEHRLAEARAAEIRARLEVERDVRTAFLALEEARERLAVSEAAVAAGDEALRLVTAQYAAGTATITRYLEAEVGRADARSRAIAARYDVARAEAGLLRAMGHWR